jgi:hypothetical protein
MSSPELMKAPWRIFVMNTPRVPADDRPGARAWFCPSS